MRDALDSLEPLLGPCAGEPAPLTGGITNRNYRVVLGDRAYALRLPARGLEALGIDRGTERACATWAGEQGLGPRVVVTLGDECLVTEWVDGAPVEAGEVPDGAVRGIARGLRALHGGPRLEHSWDPVALAEEQAALARERGVEVPADAGPCLAAGRRVRAWTAGHPDHAPRPCHNDLLPGNILWDGARAWLVDWDYAAEGDPYFDLANFARNCGLTGAQQELLLREYLGAPPDARRREALALLQVVSDLREAMWGVVQQALSDLDFDYAAYAAEHFRRLRATLAEIRLP